MYNVHSHKHSKQGRYGMVFNRWALANFLNHSASCQRASPLVTKSIPESSFSNCEYAYKLTHYLNVYLCSNEKLNIVHICQYNEQLPSINAEDKICVKFEWVCFSLICYWIISANFQLAGKLAKVYGILSADLVSGLPDFMYKVAEV